MLKLITEQVVGPPNEPNEPVIYSSPVDPIDSDVGMLYHQETIQSFLEDVDYDAESISEGMAVIYAELEDTGFTGLGIDFGAGVTSVCLAIQGDPAVQFSLARGGDWIDNQTAQVTGTQVSKVTAIKESDFELNNQIDAGSVEGVLSIHYEDYINYVVEKIAEEVDEGDIEEEFDVPVVVTGGRSKPNGFIKLFERQLEDADIPFSFSDVHQAHTPLYSVAHGTLIVADNLDNPDFPSALATDDSKDHDRAAALRERAETDPHAITTSEIEEVVASLDNLSDN